MKAVRHQTSLSRPEMEAVTTRASSPLLRVQEEEDDLNEGCRPRKKEDAFKKPYDKEK